VTRRRGDGDNDRDDPRPLRDALSEVAADLGLAEPDAFGTLVANWPDLVGDELAAHCQPQSVRDGILRVSVDSAPRATQLRYLESNVVDRVSALVGAGVVRAVQVRVER
jgi:predicted nucleic acid-binding Zn ribbon protein